MDLLGLDLAERRRKAKFTVLRRPKGWSRQEADMLSCGLEPGAVVAIHPKHPEFLVIALEYSREAIAAVLGVSDFDHKILQGYNNPDLPFIAELQYPVLDGCQAMVSIHGNRVPGQIRLAGFFCCIKLYFYLIL